MASRTATSAALASAALCSFCWPGVLANPAHVEVGIFVVDIDRIDGLNGFWLGDMSLNWKFQAGDFPPDDQPRIGLVNGIVNFVDESGSHLSDNGEVVSRVERQVVRLWFEGTYWLFPFDEQELRVSAEVMGKNSDELIMSSSTDPDLMGIAPLQVRAARIGTSERHFETAQYNVVSWSVEAEEHFAIGMPYSKSRVTLAIQIKRDGLYYTLECFIIPSLTVIFSWATFFVPLDPILPRVVIVFICFVGQFVHLDSQLALLPEGVWCWMFSAFGFSITLLSMAVFGNIASASIVGLRKPENVDLAQAHDRCCARLLLLEYLGGYFMIWIFMDYHVLIFVVLSLCVWTVHMSAMVFYYRAAKARMARDDNRELVMEPRMAVYKGDDTGGDDDGGDGGDDGGGM